MVVSWETALQVMQTAGSADQVVVALQPELESVPTDGFFGGVADFAKQALKFVLLMVMVPLIVFAMVWLFDKRTNSTPWAALWLRWGSRTSWRSG